MFFFLIIITFQEVPHPSGWLCERYISYTTLNVILGLCRVFLQGPEYKYYITHFNGGRNILNAYFETIFFCSEEITDFVSIFN